MKKIKRFALIISLLLILFNFSCNNNPVTPPEEDQPGRRDYEWTIDTLDSFNPLYRLWGSSPNDVWAITRGTYYRDIYHFDGTQWTTGEYVLPDPYGLFSIYGFGPNEVFIGAQNRIYKFDGNSWNRFAELTKDGHDWDLVFDNIWGESSNDFYAFGAYSDEEGYANNAIIAHYYYGKWEMFNTKELFGIVERLYKNKADKKIYLQVIGGRNLTDSTHIYEYNNGNYIKIYSNLWVQGLQADISLINGEVYFSIGNKISKRINDEFKILLQVDNNNFYQRVWGRNSKDLFLMMTDGLAHYNGTDIQYLYHYPFHTQIAGAALFENEVFFLNYESSTGLKLVYHGILK